MVKSKSVTPLYSINQALNMVNCCISGTFATNYLKQQAGATNSQSGIVISVSNIFCFVLRSQKGLAFGLKALTAPPLC